jgi:hypothetical protein
MSSLAHRLLALEHDAAELLEVHRGEGHDFSRYSADPSGFLRDVLRCEPWEMQRVMAESVRDNPRTVVVAAASIGKDWLAARVALWWVFALRGLVILTGPTERQVKHILMREVRRAFSRAPELAGELFAMELRAADETGILAFTSDNADRLTGFHHPRLLVMVTEAQGVADEAHEAAAACATGPGNRLFIYGNPLHSRGEFYRIARSDAWHTVVVPAAVHPNLVEGRDVIPGAVSREWVDAMRAEYGADSNFFRSRVDAAFPDGAGIDALLRRSWIDDAVARHANLVFTARPQPVVGLDVARSLDRDASVAAVVQGSSVHALVAWRSRDLVDTAERVAHVADRAVIDWGASLAGSRVAAPADVGRGALNDPHRLRQWLDAAGMPMLEIFVDAPGVGSGVCDELLRLRRPVREYWSWRPALDDQRFANRRAEDHWRLRTMLEAGVAALPNDEQLIEELCAIEWSTDSRGRILIASKDDLRRQLRRSPDRCDAATIGLAGAAGCASGPMISTYTIAI